MNAKTRIPALALTAALGLALLGACSTAPAQTVTPATPAGVTGAPATQAPETAPTEAPAEAPVAEPTEAPVDAKVDVNRPRIGQDTPGQAPAVETAGVDGHSNDAVEAAVRSADKYAVLVTPHTDGTYMMKVFGVNSRGGFSALSESGMGTRNDPAYPSKAAALAAAPMLNGRQLDRAEYILVVH